jgi:hypothetical protein
VDIVVKTKESCSCKFVDTFRVINNEGVFKLYVNGVLIGDGIEKIKNFFENIKENLDLEDYNKVIKFLEF